MKEFSGEIFQRDLRAFKPIVYKKKFSKSSVEYRLAKTFVFGQTTYLPSIIVSVFKQVVHTTTHRQVLLLRSTENNYEKEKKNANHKNRSFSRKEINIKNSGLG